MLDVRTLIRPLLAAPFIVGGVNALRAPKPTLESAAEAAAPVASALGLSDNPETLVKLTACVQVGGGAVLALGYVPRLAALVLSASLVPSMVAGRSAPDPTQPPTRDSRVATLAKNAGMLGGLLAAALDTGGRPSVFWSGRRAARRTAQTVADTVTAGYHALPVGS